jgi:hypothetical protein
VPISPVVDLTFKALYVMPMRGPTSFSNYPAEVRRPANGFIDRDYPSRAEAWSAEIHPHVSYFRTAGYGRPGDGGSAVYARVAWEPQHVPSQAKGQSADGAWWQLAEESVDLRMLGASNDASADITAIAQAAIDAYDDITIGRGTYLISNLTVGDRKRIRTDGAMTVLRQIAGAPPGTPCLTVAGSDVVIGDLKIIGNIAADRGEQNHGMLIRGESDIANIRIGDISGEAIRGDVVIVAGRAKAHVRNVVIGDVLGRNILRNVVSITGGENIALGHVEADACGLYTLDLEPNPDSQPIRAVRVNSVRGASIGLVGLNARQTVEAVDVGFLDLDPRRTTDSSPAYGYRSSTIRHGIHARNARGLRVRNFRARNIGHQPFFYIYNAGELVGDDFVFERIDIADCGAEEKVYNTLFQCAGVRRISIGGGEAILSGADKRVLFGGLGDRIATTPDVTVTTNGQVAYGCTGGRYRVVVDGGAGSNFIGSARMATTQPGDLAGDFAQGEVIDGVALHAGDAILVKDQVDARENGYYRVNVTGAPTRRVTTGEGYFNGFVAVREGLSNAGKRFRCANGAVPGMGADDVAFVELEDFPGTAFASCPGGLVESSRIKLGRLLQSSPRFTLINTEITCQNLSFDAASGTPVAINSTLNGEYIAMGPLTRG